MGTKDREGKGAARHGMANVAVADTNGLVNGAIRSVEGSLDGTSETGGTHGGAALGVRSTRLPRWSASKPVASVRRHKQQAQRPLQIGVVGLGYWGPNLARNIGELPDAEVAWLCDARPDRVEQFSHRYPTAARTTVFEDVLKDDDVDAVVIATPVATHFELAAEALNQGKHVFVEKPLAASSAEAESLIELASARGVTLMPGHTFLYSPPVNLIRELITSGELGELYFISASRVNLGLHQRDVSVVWDLGPHDFSILRYWLDETPLHVSAASRSCILPHMPDVAFIDMTFPSGTIAHVELSWLAPSKLRRTTIVGSEKMVVYDDTSNEAVRVFDSGVEFSVPETFGDYQLSYRTGEIVTPHLPAVEPLYLELEDFCTAIRGRQSPRASMEIGLEVVRTIEAVESSLNRGGVAVPVWDEEGVVELTQVVGARSPS